MARARSVEAHRRALEAAAGVVAERGLEGLTVDEVAIRSGVAKTTIYRHWPSRLALAVDAFQSCKPTMPTPNSGDLRADLIGCFSQLVAVSAVPQMRKMFVALLHASAQDPELERLHLTFVEEQQRPVRTVLQLAQARGELPADLDVDLTVDLLIGPLMSRLLLRHAEILPSHLAVVVDIVVAGLRARAGAGPLLAT
jgi:AcrR family transcriptional regulator